MSRGRQPKRLRVSEAGYEALAAHLAHGAPIAHPGQGRIACPECLGTKAHHERCGLRNGGLAW